MEIRYGNGNIPLVDLPRRVDANTAPAMERTLQSLVRSGNKVVVCNFSGTDHMSSVGLRILLVAARALQDAGGGLRLCAVSPAVMDVLTVSGFAKILPVFASEREALQDTA